MLLGPVNGGKEAKKKKQKATVVGSMLLEKEQGQWWLRPSSLLAEKRLQTQCLQVPQPLLFMVHISVGCSAEFTSLLLVLSGAEQKNPLWQRAEQLARAGLQGVVWTPRGPQTAPSSWMQSPQGTGRRSLCGLYGWFKPAQLSKGNRE